MLASKLHLLWLHKIIYNLVQSQLVNRPLKVNAEKLCEKKLWSYTIGTLKVKHPRLVTISRMLCWTKSKLTVRSYTSHISKLSQSLIFSTKSYFKGKSYWHIIYYSYFHHSYTPLGFISTNFHPALLSITYYIYILWCKNKAKGSVWEKSSWPRTFEFLGSLI